MIARALTLIRLDLPSPTRLVVHLVARLNAAATLRRQRRALLTLDDRALADIGLTRTDVTAEATRPFWDAPRDWRC